ncbi:MAG TPA: 1-(5-phosphoribosyl)-5-[(5-phosphoribosylamino)methylideneamino]imidazole-4-carboxamide isomerase [Elusimicrobiota bacterium]|nr:1-(5-phosphoribosyl)-5-[(5-phosphoribosylamino)methylideneamino]imidazole-4-carboxamide isomerase [Elusimicrobiota bacterium]
MILYPALDLLDGKAVRLTHGDYSKVRVYSEDPASVLEGFRAAGARFAHLVDLNGARDPHTRQKNWIEPLLRIPGLKVQVGGGVRTREDAEQLLSWGADRVVIGSAAVANPDLVESLLGDLDPKRLTLAADVKNGPDGLPRVAIKGWSETTDARLASLITRFRAKGLTRVLCTDISRDGAAKGPNASLYRLLVDTFPGLEIQASGGVRDLDDLNLLKGFRVHSAVVGTALYEGTLNLGEALAAC